MKEPKKASLMNQCLLDLCKKSFTQREMITLGMIIGVALLLRILVTLPGWSEMPEHFSRPDTAGYIRPAMGLASWWGYSEPGSVVPETARPPGFPVFLAVFFKLFGTHYGPPIVALCLVGALTCVPVFLAGRYFGGCKVGYIAAALLACNLTAVVNSPMLLSDTLYGFITAWQLFFFIRFHFKREFQFFLAAMAFAALGTLIRPIGLMWVIPGVFLCLIQPEIKWPHKLGIAIAGTVLFLCIIFPWMARNRSVGAGFSIDANTGSMYHQNGAMLLSRVNGTSYEVEKQQILKALDKEFADSEKYPDTASQQKYRVQKFRELIMQHPFTYLTLHFRPAILLPDASRLFELLGLTTGGRGTLDVIHRKGIIAGVKHYFGDRLWMLFLLIPALIIPAVTYAGCLAQLGIWIYNKNVYLIFFFLAFVEYFFFLPGPITVPRYQIPALPLMTVMAAIAIPSFIVKVKNYYLKKRKSFT
jgi:4-amino-4-deoxy-L-arabinose transferase-like glycosyltransferase